MKYIVRMCIKCFLAQFYMQCCVYLGAPVFTQGFQWGWCGTICTFICSVVYISEHLSLPNVLVGLVWHDLQFSMQCCVYLGAPEFTQGFQWGRCGTICSFLCSVVYISEHLSLLQVFSGIGVARSVVFCVVLCISLHTTHFFLSKNAASTY